ncbi:hypothetical protein ACFE04_016387 [Oxalis oulophora]
MSTKIIAAMKTCFLIWLALVIKAEAAEFHVKKYGAKADGKTDDAKAIMSAWKEACQSKDKSTVVIGGGTYLAGPLTFNGPCKAPISMKVQGTIKAPTDVNKLKSQDGWVIFHGINALTLSGGGAFDGQGELAWKQNDCAKTGKCSSLPIPVIGVTVKNCVFTNTMNGVRVKTWPASPSGVASNLHFEDITMNNVSTPVLIDQGYCPYGNCQSEIPSKIKISDVRFKNIHGTSATQVAVQLVCSKGIPCTNVEVGDINLKYNGQGDATSTCENVQPKLTGKLVPQPCTTKPSKPS